MKLQNYPIFKQWCELTIKNKNVFGMMYLDEPQIDKGIAAFCMDSGCLMDAQLIDSPFTPSVQKNIIFSKYEHKCDELIDQYYTELNDADDAKVKDQKDKEKSLLGNLRQILPSELMFEAGHKHADF